MGLLSVNIVIWWKLDSLLDQSNLPTSFWVDAFSIAMHLINHLITPLLNFESLYSNLFQKSPNYFRLRMFGCTCYPLLRSNAPNKLAFQNKQCIFLGYFSNHKGYWCFDPISKNVYLSQHVIFNDNLFPIQRQVDTSRTLALPNGIFSPKISLYPTLSWHLTPLNQIKFIWSMILKTPIQIHLP